MFYLAAGFVAVIVILMATRPYRNRRRAQRFAKEFATVKQLCADGKYEQVVDRLQNVAILRTRYKLRPEQRRQVTELEVLSLERLDRIPDAVVALAHHLSAAYEAHHWPDDLLSKWVSLYNSCQPIEVEKFYFCPSCGLHPEMRPLLKLAIERGCEPPIGFPGKGGPAVLIEFGGKKTRNSSNSTPKTR